MADAQSQPDALALADSVKFAIQHRDKEIERLRAALEEIADKTIAFEYGSMFAVKIARKALKQSDQVIP